jgi:alpha-D-ribose 1-methylphosphonate 5-triphosphate diphosphatase
MDHTPGQGQFKSIETWKKFHVPVYELSEEQADFIIKDKQNNQGRAYQIMEDLLRYAADRNIRLLSHDDDSKEKIDLLFDLGISISEFPLDLNVAAYARSKGLGTGMGSPNVVRGRSQGGNISARDLISDGGCDFLCSDYHPSSMLQAPYTLHRELGMNLEDGFAMITSQPARLAGLDDRGRICEGCLADIVAIEDRWVPKVVLTLKEGSAVYNATGCLCTEGRVKNAAAQ